jgi:tetratricopeptide (TPR) repeat protein
MMKSYLKQGDDARVLDVYKAAKGIICFNFGEYHPLNSTFNSLLGYHYFLSKKYSESIFFYKTGLDECIRNLGIAHQYTGQMFLDVANVYLAMGKRHDAIMSLEKAFGIFEVAKLEDATEKADLASQIGTFFRSNLQPHCCMTLVG